MIYIYIFSYVSCLPASSLPLTLTQTPCYSIKLQSQRHSNPPPPPAPSPSTHRIIPAARISISISDSISSCPTERAARWQTCAGCGRSFTPPPETSFWHDGKLIRAQSRGDNGKKARRLMRLHQAPKLGQRARRRQVDASAPQTRPD